MADFGQRRECFYQFIRKGIRVQIQDADPADAGNVIQVAEQFRQAQAAIQVRTVDGRILGYDNQFLDPRDARSLASASTCS